MADLGMKVLTNMEPLGSSLKIQNAGRKGEEGGSFANTLADSLKEVNQYQLEADNAIENLVAGKSKNIHETMIALSKAEIAFKLTMQVRNKVIEAYEEVMRTAV
ncbi:MAG: flagellar hook-basal body complex protein FliE [Candidatus Nitrospinota bacterium M3_3B_026]